MNRLMKLFEHLPEVLRRDQAGEPTLFPPADPAQRPRFYLPDLDARPWHDAGAFPWMAAFEKSFAAIRTELEAFLAQQQVLLKDFKDYAPRVAQRVKEHVRTAVEQAGGTFRYLGESLAQAGR